VCSSDLVTIPRKDLRINLNAVFPQLSQPLC